MFITATDYRGRHWITHNDGVMNYAACGSPLGITSFPPVMMPSVCVDCERCANQLERFEMAQLNGDIPMHIPSTRDYPELEN